MRVLTESEYQIVTGGCVACPVAPGTCLAIGAGAAAVTYFGFEELSLLIPAVIVMIGGYFAYDMWTHQAETDLTHSNSNSHAHSPTHHSHEHHHH